MENKQNEINIQIESDDEDDGNDNSQNEPLIKIVKVHKNGKVLVKTPNVVGPADHPPKMSRPKSEISYRKKGDSHGKPCERSASDACKQDNKPTVQPIKLENIDPVKCDDKEKVSTSGSRQKRAKVPKKAKGYSSLTEVNPDLAGQDEGSSKSSVQYSKTKSDHKEKTISKIKSDANLKPKEEVTRTKSDSYVKNQENMSLRSQTVSLHKGKDDFFWVAAMSVLQMAVPHKVKCLTSVQHHRNLCPSS